MAGPAAGDRRSTGNARSRRRARRSRRRTRPPARATRARGRCRRRAPRAADGTARHREDDAGPSAADHPVAARRRRGARGDAHPLRGRSRAPAWSGPPAPVPRAAPHGVDRCARRRRVDPAPPRRSDTRASRSVVPRRTGRVPAALARRVAPAHRRARGADLAPGDVGRVPVRLPPHRVLEPVPVRSGWPELRMHRDPTRPLPPPPVGATARPLRPAPRGPPARAGRRARRAIVRGA